jgi:uncharacterized protein (TIGR04141 family)
MANKALSVYLLKDDVAADRDALKPEREGIRTHDVSAGDVRGTLFVQQQIERVPPWLALFGPYIQPRADDRTFSSSAVSVLHVGSRRFALTFGNGWTMLDPRRYERRFGMRVALNALDPELLRGAQARTLGESVMHTQRQLSRLAGIDAFALDWQQELVTALEGTTRADVTGVRLTGHDAARITADIDAKALATLCAELLELSQQTGYLQHFPNIDDIEEITDPEQIQDLDVRLASRLGQRTWGDVDLYPPDLVSGDVVDFYVMRRGRQTVVDEPTTGTLLSPLIPTLTDASRVRRLLDSQMLVARDGDKQPVQEWPLWDCLYYETQVAGERVILDGGSWYRIKKTLVDKVDAFVATLKPSGLALPEAVPNESEGQYNLAAADTLSIALLDTQNITLVGRSAIEPCDLFTGQREIIHVKKRKGGSGPLSHLIGQAVVSAELLKGDAEFRDALRDKLARAMPGYEALITDTIDAPSYPIILALITTSGVPGEVAKDLPFFTKVFLMKNVERLISMGFPVYIDEIRTGVILTGRPDRDRRTRLRRLKQQVTARMAQRVT